MDFHLTALVVVSILLSTATFSCFWSYIAHGVYLEGDISSLNKQTQIIYKDELEAKLEATSMSNKTLIIVVLNKPYTIKNGMLDLFLESLELGENTAFLRSHLLVVAVDQIAYEKCITRELNCHRLLTDDADFSKEKIYMSKAFNNMMWRRTLFLLQVLKRGYNFVFTDMDVMWLRNPMPVLGKEEEDMQFSVDWFNGRPLDDHNFINTGFYFAASNNKTITLFQRWYDSRNESNGKKDQDVLAEMKDSGVFRQLEMKVSYLDTKYFGGFCANSGGFKLTKTMHSNCCRSIKAKLTDLKVVLEEWKRFNGTDESSYEWTKYKACHQSWKTNIKLD